LCFGSANLWIFPLDGSCSEGHKGKIDDFILLNIQ
jgi:hypothetical protein